MKKLFFLFLTIPLIGFAIECEKHPIYCKIKKLSPNKPHDKSMELSNLIYKYSKKYQTDPMISVAIAMQETGIKNKDRKQTIAVLKENGEYEIVKGFTDFSIFQFHINTILDYKLDIKKLRHDLSYMVESHIIILRDKMKLCKNLKNDSWSCYHSKSKILREHYVKLVKRYY